MNRRPHVWALLGVVSCALACGNEAVPGPASAGATSVGTAGTDAGLSGSGGAAAGGNSGGSAGNGGSVTGGSAAGGASAGNGGAGGSSAGSGSASGSGGSAGSGGSGSSTLPKRVLLYHFSTLVIPSVPAQITLLKTQLTTWGYEVEDSVKPEDLSATNLAASAASA